MALFLGIDVGTSSTKSVVLDARGSVKAQASESYPLSIPQPLWSEQDPEDWWRAVQKSIRRVVRTLGTQAKGIRGIGLSGQMHGSVFLDAAHRVLRPAILWNDQRTAAECVEIERLAGGRRRLLQLVANPALTGFTAPKILWLRRHEPWHFEKTRTVLLPKDEIRRRLTGELATDVSDASGTLLLDVSRRCWSTKLLQRLDLDSRLLPACHESVEITGQLRPDVARRLGLPSDCVVVAGAGDCAAGAIGMGIVKPGDVAASIGTSGVVFVHSDQPQQDPEGRLHTFCHAVPNKWHMMGVSLTAGGAFEWFLQALCPDLEGTPRSRSQRLDAEAAQICPGSEGLYFLPYLAGERTPHADPAARGAWIGITLKHSRGHLTRSVLEGVGFALRDSLTILQELHVPTRRIRISGGGARSTLWRQILADIFGQPVRTLAVEEGAAFGVALLAAVACGEFRDIQEACRVTIHEAEETRPNPATKRRYAQYYPRFRKLYQSLREDFRAMATFDNSVS